MKNFKQSTVSKRYLLIFMNLFFLFSSYFSISQFGTEKIITLQALGSREVVASDIDGDGFMDLVSANMFGSSITWNRNIEGSGEFSEIITILTIQEPLNVNSADIDGDGDMDIIAAAGFQNELVWLENMDGQGTFSSAKLISDMFSNIRFIAVADIDDDGDIDVAIGTDESQLVWLRNSNGNGNFQLAQVINNNAPTSRSITIADFDGDGDLDIAGSSSGSTTVSWYENEDGAGLFGSQQEIAGKAFTVSSIFAGDIDSDGDADIVATTNADNKVSWYENLNGEGTFGEELIISENVPVAISVNGSDLDNDGDLDLLVAGAGSSAGDKSVTWFENLDGLGSFSKDNLISNNGESTFEAIAVDLDNDGDLDIVSASRNDDKLAWYENFTVLGLEETHKNVLQIYPNPTAAVSYMEIPQELVVQEILVYDLSGRITATLQEDERRLDLSSAPKGIYFIRIQADGQSYTKRLIKN